MNTTGDSTSTTPTTLEAALLDVLRSATATPTLAFDGRPGRLTGGFYAELVRFRLQDAPEGWQGDLVARVMPDSGIAAKETAVQAEVAAQGYPTPTVRLAGGPEAGLGQAFMVMDLAAGGPLLGSLGGLGAVAALPRLARRLPVTLATAMADLHRLDAAPLRARLKAAGATGVGVDAALASLAMSVELSGRPDLLDAARWLQGHSPAAAPEVICHGDLHPFNVLVAADGAVTVLDWSASLLAPCLYDVAFTGLVLAEPPVAVPRAVRPLVRAAGRFLSRRFHRAYAERAGHQIDPESLQWHEAVICLRVLAEVADWVAKGRAEGRDGHPWLTNSPAFAERLSRLTGVAVSPR